MREIAAREGTDSDFIAVQMGSEKLMLFPLKQDHVKEVYQKMGPVGQSILETTPLNHAVGYAPLAVPFSPTDDHWKVIRKGLSGTFHSDWMEGYINGFIKSTGDGVERIGASATVNLREEIFKMTYESACYAIFGAVINVDLPYATETGTVDKHVRDFKNAVIIDWAKQALDKRFYDDEQYRTKVASLANYDKNVGTLADAVQGLAVGRIGELDGGAEGRKTLVDGAIGLFKAGAIESVPEFVHDGWVLLVGGNENICAGATAAMYYLL